MKNGLLILIGLILVGGAPAFAQKSPAPDDARSDALQLILARLTSIEERLNRLEKETAPGAASTVSPGPVSVPSGLDARLEALDQRIRIVDRQREIDQETAAARLAESPAVDASRDGFALRSADRAFQVKINGYMQIDGRFYVGPRQVDTSTFLLRRIRPILQGTIYKNLEFRIMPDFGLGQFVLQEAYGDLRFWPKASLRFGKYKGPFGLERLQSAADLTFIDRSLPTNLAPNRDVGVTLFGDLAKGAVSYAIAAMNGVPDGGSADVDTNKGKDAVARVFVQPFQRKTEHPLNGLGFGIAGSHGRQQGPVLPTYRTVSQSPFFSYASGVNANGDRQRYGPQAYYYVGPFGLLAEYTTSSQDVNRGNAGKTITNTAWQIAASYFLTGEKKSYRSTAPWTPLDPASEGRGAWEVAARYANLSVDRSAFDGGFADITKSARQAREWLVGVNWHLNRSNKFVFDYGQTHFTGGAGAGNRVTERAILTRYQIAF